MSSTLSQSVEAPTQVLTRADRVLPVDSATILSQLASCRVVFLNAAQYPKLHAHVRLYWRAGQDRREVRRRWMQTVRSTRVSTRSVPFPTFQELSSTTAMSSTNAASYTIGSSNCSRGATGSGAGDHAQVSSTYGSQLTGRPIEDPALPRLCTLTHAIALLAPYEKLVCPGLLCSPLLAPTVAEERGRCAWAAGRSGASATLPIAMCSQQRISQLLWLALEGGVPAQEALLFFSLSIVYLDLKIGFKAGGALLLETEDAYFFAGVGDSAGVAAVPTECASTGPKFVTSLAMPSPLQRFAPPVNCPSSFQDMQARLRGLLDEFASLESETTHATNADSKSSGNAQELSSPRPPPPQSSPTGSQPLSRQRVNGSLAVALLKLAAQEWEERRAATVTAASPLGTWAAPLFMRDLGSAPAPMTTTTTASTPPPSLSLSASGAKRAGSSTRSTMPARKARKGDAMTMGEMEDEDSPTSTAEGAAADPLPPPRQVAAAPARSRARRRQQLAAAEEVAAAFTPFDDRDSPRASHELRLPPLPQDPLFIYFLPVWERVVALCVRTTGILYVLREAILSVSQQRSRELVMLSRSHSRRLQPDASQTSTATQATAAKSAQSTATANATRSSLRQTTPASLVPHLRLLPSLGVDTTSFAFYAPVDGSWLWSGQLCWRGFRGVVARCAAEPTELHLHPVVSTNTTTITNDCYIYGCSDGDRPVGKLSKGTAAGQPQTRTGSQQESKTLFVNPTSSSAAVASSFSSSVAPWHDVVLLKSFTESILCPHAASCFRLVPSVAELADLLTRCGVTLRTQRHGSGALVAPSTSLIAATPAPSLPMPPERGPAALHPMMVLPRHVAKLALRAFAAERFDVYLRCQREEPEEMQLRLSPNITAVTMPTHSSGGGGSVAPVTVMSLTFLSKAGREVSLGPAPLLAAGTYETLRNSSALSSGSHSLAGGDGRGSDERNHSGVGDDGRHRAFTTLASLRPVAEGSLADATALVQHLFHRPDKVCRRLPIYAAAATLGSAVKHQDDHANSQLSSSSKSMPSQSRQEQGQKQQRQHLVSPLVLNASRRVVGHVNVLRLLRAEESVLLRILACHPLAIYVRGCGVGQLVLAAADGALLIERRCGQVASWMLRDCYTGKDLRQLREPRVVVPSPRPLPLPANLIAAVHATASADAKGRKNIGAVRAAAAVGDDPSKCPQVSRVGVECMMASYLHLLLKSNASLRKEDRQLGLAEEDPLTSQERCSPSTLSANVTAIRDSDIQADTATTNAWAHCCAPDLFTPHCVLLEEDKEVAHYVLRHHPQYYSHIRGCGIANIFVAGVLREVRHAAREEKERVVEVEGAEEDGFSRPANDNFTREGVPTVNDNNTAVKASSSPSRDQHTSPKRNEEVSCELVPTLMIALVCGRQVLCDWRESYDEASGQLRPHLTLADPRALKYRGHPQNQTHAPHLQPVAPAVTSESVSHAASRAH